MWQKICGIGLVLMTLMVQADEKNGDWQYYSNDTSSVFFIGSTPQSQKGTFKKRGPAYITVTSRPRQKTFDVVGVTSGYPYKEGSQVTVIVFSKGQKKIKEYTLFTQGDWAWTDNDATDKALVESMKKGEALLVKGESQKGTYSEDTYSLKGFTAAYQKLSKKAHAS